MIQRICPVCQGRTCPPSGKSHEILVIGDFPGDLDMQLGTPFAGTYNYMTAGRIFRKELERIGVHFTQFRIMNLWMHPPNDNENCYQAGYDNVLTEAKGKKAILLVGSDVVECFTAYKVSDVTGLQVDSSVLSAPIIYAMVNPALALHRGVGEVRNGIEKFVARLEEEKLI